MQSILKTLLFSLLLVLIQFSLIVEPAYSTATQKPTLEDFSKEDAAKILTKVKSFIESDKLQPFIKNSSKWTFKILGTEPTNGKEKPTIIVGEMSSSDERYLLTFEVKPTDKGDWTVDFLYLSNKPIKLKFVRDILPTIVPAALKKENGENDTQKMKMFRSKNLYIKVLEESADKSGTLMFIFFDQNESINIKVLYSPNKKAKANLLLTYEDD